MKNYHQSTALLLVYYKLLNFLLINAHFLTVRVNKVLSNWTELTKKHISTMKNSCRAREAWRTKKETKMKRETWRLQVWSHYSGESCLQPWELRISIYPSDITSTIKEDSLKFLCRRSECVRVHECVYMHEWVRICGLANVSVCVSQKLETGFLCDWQWFAAVLPTGETTSIYTHTLSLQEW